MFVDRRVPLFVLVFKGDQKESRSHLGGSPSCLKTHTHTQHTHTHTTHTHTPNKTKSNRVSRLDVTRRVKENILSGQVPAAKGLAWLPVRPFDTPSKV